MATVECISRKQGDTYPIEVTVKSDLNTPYDMTGATAIQLGIAAASSLESPDVPLAVLTGTIVDAASGRVDFAISGGAEDLDPGSYYAEIQFVQSTYVITTDTFPYHVKGQIII